MKTFLQPLTAREEREYLRQYKEGDREARNVLISRNMRLVAHVIKKYQNSGYETEDLLSPSASSRRWIPIIWRRAPDWPPTRPGV